MTSSYGRDDLAAANSVELAKTTSVPSSLMLSSVGAYEAAMFPPETTSFSESGIAPDLSSEASPSESVLRSGKAASPDPGGSSAQRRIREMSTNFAPPAVAPFETEICGLKLTFGMVVVGAAALATTLPLMMKYIVEEPASMRRRC
jgi:hypothetical protein